MPSVMQFFAELEQKTEELEELIEESQEERERFKNAEEIISIYTKQND